MRRFWHNYCFKIVQSWWEVDQVIWLGEPEIWNVARGAAVLGSGGGGSTENGLAMAVAAVRRMGPVRLVSPHELGDDALVMPAAFMGSPTIQSEKIPGRDALVAPIRALEAHLGRRADALAPVEVGGVNCLITLAMAASTGLPLVDGDGFGRALPELQMLTFSIYGMPGSPFVLVNDRGDEVLIRTRDNLALEHVARGVTLRFGGLGYLAGYAMEGRRFKECAVLYTVSLAERIGRALRQADGNLRESVLALASVTANSTYGQAVLLADGQVIGVQRRSGDGWGRGICSILDELGRRFQLHFQNEFLYVESEGEPIAMVPDILVVLEVDSQRFLCTDELVYGQRVLILAIPVPAILRTAAALQAIGPRAFGYELDYEPVESLATRSKGVISGYAVDPWR